MSYGPTKCDLSADVSRPPKRWLLVAWRCLVRACFGLFGLYAAFVGCMVFLPVSSLHDDFADHLTIPDNLDVTSPLPEGKFTPEMGSAMRHGNPEMILKDGMQPGIYRLYAWANPGEPGGVYVRAYEVTHETRLSEPDLSQSTSNTAQWSVNQDEQFRYSAKTMIYEGDWGYPYAARFELWFKPSTGAPERKLVERVFRIEGWER